MTFDPTRADYAQAALKAYIRRKGGRPDEADFRDLLTDLMHLAARDGAGRHMEHDGGGLMTFAESLGIACQCYGDETPLAELSAKPNADGPYRPELAQAFREGARDLLQCNLGDQIDLPEGALLQEGPDGGAYVHVRLFVSDGQRLPLPGEGEDA